MVRSRPEAHCGASAVVLVHGYMCTSRTAYWRGLTSLRRDLLAAGCAVVVSCVPRTGDVASRALHLAQCLARLPQRRLVLVGHSMGGLDVRYVASRLDPERRIRHVVTLGTPHLGTPLADWALRDRLWLARMLRFVDRGALDDLTSEGAGRLDEMMPDRPDVGYVAMAGACPPEQLTGAFRRLAERVAEREGANDGLVSLGSASRWDAPIVVDAHHLELIGHPFRYGMSRPQRGASTPPRDVPSAILGLLPWRGPGPVAARTAAPERCRRSNVSLPTIHGRATERWASVVSEAG